MEWISVKDRRPSTDCICVVYNEKRMGQYYISFYSKFFDEFDIHCVGSFIRLPDPISFNATHWMAILAPSISAMDNKEEPC